MTNPARFDLAIVGGLGHVGLPLGITFANKGLKVCLHDLDEKNAELVRRGAMPFLEYDAEPVLKKVIANGNLAVSTEPSCLSEAKTIIIAIGTPVDEYLNPKTRQFLEIILGLKKYFNKNQTIIIRSTVYPHTCKQLLKQLNQNGKEQWHIAYCPERIMQGHAMRELLELPQLVAGLSEKAIKDSTELFSIISPKIIPVSIGEAELAKLFANAWRYIQFAITNQFYMIAHNFGADYNKVRKAMIDGYKRAETLPTAGFAAGPCLLKDTMQLAAYSGNSFLLGHTAMMVNEGLPHFIVEDLKKRWDLSNTKVGILGMAFKADIDDVRDSLSFKLGKILRFDGAKVYYSDEYAKNPDFVTKEELIRESQVIIVAVPHSQYKGLVIQKGKEVLDLWGVIKQEQ
ncbi:nucleotide sugar dehydrogenase [Candidatus Woesearchaeota archaeon]|nr:nucleotide sugar dehydrogenase [Candidatus Woesearchaeota archaeon]